MPFQTKPYPVLRLTQSIHKLVAKSCLLQNSIVVVANWPSLRPRSTEVQGGALNLILKCLSPQLKLHHNVTLMTSICSLHPFETDAPGVSWLWKPDCLVLAFLNRTVVHFTTPENLLLKVQIQLTNCIT